MQDFSNLMDSTNQYPFQVNWGANQVYLLGADPAFYQDAAFLDQRAIRPGMQGSWQDWDQVRAEALSSHASPLGLIFHIGHCGSTLISRALGLLNGLFCLREPLPFRDLAISWTDRTAPWTQKTEAALLEDMAALRALWARTPGAAGTSIVKTTSFCSLMAAPWLAHFPKDRAVCLSMAPEVYLATVLGAPAYITDLAGGAKPRMVSLMEATGADLAPLSSLSPGELGAMTYLAEMTNMQQAADVAGDRMLRVDFDRYLKDPAETLIALSQHFGHPAGEQTIATALVNPVLGRYSKATDYAFSATDRRDRLAASRAENRSEIAKGMNWLVSFARTHDLAANALRAFGYAS
ncbi:hypothetical protein [Kordiimonas lacus]|uniref:Sulfotransferase family protein n=1 Tax=Kordiimonas lacus TaxID=637679 RepID=A0A1G6Y3D7_9PROT|nr:hypothetical protein [Kordiimonas lacus]SDD84145.1 hypothetical protein SAMN04488071_1446 [Kordiimonas lacus]